MSHAHITINDQVMLDGDWAELIARPPEFLTDLFAKMQPDSAQKPEAHMLSVGGTFGLALLKQTDITIDVVTGPDWWTMTVKEK